MEFRGGAGAPAAGSGRGARGLIPPTPALFRLECWAREHRPDLLARLRAAQRAVEEAFLPHEEEAAWAEFEAAKAALERAWREWAAAGGVGGLFSQEKPGGETCDASGGSGIGRAPSLLSAPVPGEAVHGDPGEGSGAGGGDGEAALDPAPAEPSSRTPAEKETRHAPPNESLGEVLGAVRSATREEQPSLFAGEPGAVPEAFRSPWEDWLDAAEVVRVSGLAAWRAALEEARAAGICALDTETTGLDPLQNRIRLVQLAVPLYPEGKKRLVASDWRSPEPGGGVRVYVLDLFALPLEGDRREALEALAELVADPGVLKVGHNLKFDLAFLRAGLGGRRIFMERLFDTMLASQLVTAGDFVPGGQWERWCAERSLRPAKNDRGQELKATRVDAHGHLVEFEHDNQKEIKPFYPTHSLQQVAHRHLEAWLPKDLQASDWRGELSEGQVRYAARDAAALLPLYEVLARLLALNRLVDVARVEFACLPAVVEVELSGMPFDAPRARELLTAAREEAARHRAELEILAAGAGFAPRPKKGRRAAAGLNPDSSQDVLDCLRLLAEGEGLLAGGRLSVGGEEFDLETRDETLSRLAFRLPEGSPLRRFAGALRAYRAAKKRADFLTRWLEKLHPATDRLHPNLRQINPQGVGRFSASEANIQQAPRGSEIRQLFHAPEGRKLVVADFSGIEMRIMAQLSGDRAMIAAFRDGADIHRRTAAAISGKPEEDVTKEERQAAKACFSGDTEILTIRGWVRFDEYDGHTPVAQFVLPEGFGYNPPRSPGNRWIGSRKKKWDGRGRIEFVRPLAFRSFEGRTLVRFSDRNVDLLLTPDHEIVWIDTNGRPRKGRADEVAAGNVKYFVAAGFLERGEGFGLTEAETRVLAMAVADGSFKRCFGTLSFGFSKLKKVERCRSLLQACGLDFRESTYTNGKYGSAIHFVVKDRAFVEKLMRYVTLDKELKPEALSELNPLWYLDEAKYWDARVVWDGRKGERVHFFTACRQTADVMQAMATLCGIPSVLKRSADGTYVLSYRLLNGASSRPVWRLGGKKKEKLFETVPGLHKVYCVQVPSGAILVRRNGKVVVCGNCNFGLIYGMAAETLRLYAEASYGVRITPEEAEVARQAFFRTYPAVAAWHSRQARQGRESGFADYWRHDFERGFYRERRPWVRTLGGRLRVWPVVQEQNGPRKAGAFTELYNSPDQGTGADMLKCAMARLYRELLRRGWEDVKLVATVHDELVLEAPGELAEQAADLLGAVMELTASRFLPDVPVEVEVAVCGSWAEK